MDPSDRIRAIDVMGKYGIGTLRELSVEQVSERLRDTIEVIREMLPRDSSGKSPFTTEGSMVSMSGVWPEEPSPDFGEVFDPLRERKPMPTSELVAAINAMTPEERAELFRDPVRKARFEMLAAIEAEREVVD